MVKRALTDPTPVTRSFLLKTALSMLGIIAAMLVFSFQVGGWFGNYQKLSKIPVADIQKAVEYSVYDQDTRKDYYRDYMNRNDIKNAHQDSAIDSLKIWQLDVKSDLKSIKRDINIIKQAVIK